MNGLKIFENPDFGSVRVTVDVSNEPVFCAADVRAALLDTLTEEKLLQTM